MATTTKKSAYLKGVMDGLPFILVIFHQSLDFVYESWRVNEQTMMQP